MEFHLDQVLYRDQRTIRTRYLFIKGCQSKLRAPWHKKSPILNCKEAGPSPSRMKSPQVDTVQQNSSLDAKVYCHNQYCSKFKRLQSQTEVECGCEGSDSEGRRSETPVRCKTWMKKFHNLLPLIVCLCLIRYASAVPTTISSRTTLYKSLTRSNEMAESNSFSNLIACSAAANSAQNTAWNLKENFTRRAGNRLTQDQQQSNWAYPWLPNVLDPDANKTEFEQHLESLGPSQFARELMTHLRVVNFTIKEITDDLGNREASDPIRDYYGDFPSMRGMLNNLIDELQTSIKINESEPTEPDPELAAKLEEVRSDEQTHKLTRDWIFIKKLVEVIDYAVAGIHYFAAKEGVHLERPH